MSIEDKLSTFAQLSQTQQIKSIKLKRKRLYQNYNKVIEIKFTKFYKPKDKFDFNIFHMRRLIHKIYYLQKMFNLVAY